MWKLRQLRRQARALKRCQRTGQHQWRWQWDSTFLSAWPEGLRVIENVMRNVCDCGAEELISTWQDPAYYLNTRPARQPNLQIVRLDD